LNNNDYSYFIGETVDIGCTAIDDVDGPVNCTYSGTIDTSTVGDYDITYSATDSSNNTATLIQTYTVTNDYLSMDLMTYYDDAEGLEGTALELALRTIINNGFSGVSYGDTRYYLDDTDADQNNSSNVILVYQQTSVSGVWDGGITWNREHVWPQSLLGVSVDNNDINVGSDLHNLKPADPGENSSRSNKYFDNVTSTVAYEPPDEVKGDIARILFYMIVMYDYLDLVDGTPGIYEMGQLQTLLSWHDLDPVDDFERDRNEAIYGIQGNRNPFIDYEHFVELIFGSESYYNN
jgi:endonuclease I